MALPTAPTYSIANAGGTLVAPLRGLAAAGSNFNGTKVHMIPDTTDAGTALPNPAICYSGIQSVMADGDSFLYKNPDGAIKRGKFDAERSTPGNLVIIPV